jgi:hypothetical protein
MQAPPAFHAYMQERKFPGAYGQRNKKRRRKMQRRLSFSESADT